MRVYHGTSFEAARDIARNGIDFAKCHGGYFGIAFHITADRALASKTYGQVETVAELLELEWVKRAMRYEDFHQF